MGGRERAKEGGREEERDRHSITELLTGPPHLFLPSPHYHGLKTFRLFPLTP